MKTTKFFRFLWVPIIIISCAVNPYTGKKTMAFIPNSELFPTAFKEYDSFLSENKVIDNTKDANMIKRVGERITKAAEDWMSSRGFKKELLEYKWEYKLVQDSTRNAWCMPGGKIVFYSGILPIAKTEAGIAAIMGHEVAHALANHGQQRMSAGIIQQSAAQGVAIATKEESETKQRIFMQAFGIGSSVLGILPFSRKHETEADEIGILLMAIAGYNPEEAHKLWERMQSANSSSSPPQILSTHPSNDSRIANLKRMIPKAKAEASKFGINNFQN